MPRRRATPVTPAPDTGYRDPELAYDYPTYQNIPNFDCHSPAEYRDKCGKWKKGCPGGPGRPRKKPPVQHIDSEIQTACANVATLDMWKELAAVTFQAALKGD